ncbi:MAG: MmcQ/YjbR family DNA-binding protein [Emcibacter sp.]|nr:MmcQ/YjbR family DNA-binding protein [Emcibacter sp.]
MIREEFDNYCSSLTSVTHVVQWGGASVWKVGGKIFAICSHWGTGEQQKISFKCSDLSYHILCELPDITPAPYLARAKWVQIKTADAMNDDDIQDYIKTAYQIICRKLTRAKRKELNL